MFETDFIDSQKSNSPFAHLLALSHMSYVKFFIHKFYLFTCYTDGIFENKFPFKDKLLSYFTLDDRAGHAHKNASLLLMYVAS